MYEMCVSVCGCMRCKCMCEMCMRFVCVYVICVSMSVYESISV